MEKLSWDEIIDLSQELGSLQNIKSGNQNPLRELEIQLELCNQGLIEKKRNLWNWIVNDPISQAAKNCYMQQLTN